VDKSGKITINPQFDAAGDFSDGMALVKSANRFGYIDKSGKFVINPQFQGAGNFHAGLAPVWTCDRRGYINKSGKYVWNSMQAASNPADTGSNLPPQADAAGQPCSDGQVEPAQTSMYGDGSAQQYESQGYVESMYKPVLIVDQPVAPEATAAPMEEAQPYSTGTYYKRGHWWHRRSRKRSAAIIIGSAAAGAGIGALAGGGKGAEIGAASGGTAGFVYDRMTRNR
jgi:hypothetical protein